jgi:hypothetical protein
MAFPSVIPSNIIERKPGDVVATEDEKITSEEIALPTEDDSYESETLEENFGREQEEFEE